MCVLLAPRVGHAADGRRHHQGRRLAAVWFCDIVGSTEVAGELGDAAYRRLVAQYLAAVRSTLRRHGGREVDTAGDGVFATFDVPAAALRAALEATGVVRELGVEIRTGVHLGEVEQSADGTVRGIAVHLGARVMSLAHAGEVLTTRTTSELASGAGFLFEDRGSHELKGIPGSHTILALVGADGSPLEPPLAPDEARLRRAAAAGAPERERPDRRARGFVGRDRELDELHAALADSVLGRGSLRLISGEPGIGKSRLIAVVAEEAEAQGWLVAVGRCWEGGGAPAYWPWIQVVREAGGEFAQIAGVAEGVAATASRPGLEGISDPTDPDSARFQLFDRVGRYLVRTANERPSLIVLEDLHAADEPSLLLLRFVATSIGEQPLVLLASYRDADRRVRARAELFGDLARLGRRLPLRGLTPDEVASYVALASGTPSSHAFAARIGEVTGGNPFFIGEIVRELSAHGQLAPDARPEALPLPEEVRALIRRRLEELGPVALDVLRIAAVIGREFDLRVMSSATPLAAGQVINGLDEAGRAGVIAERRGAARTYRFTHDLVRETLYEDIGAAERMELHRTVGRVLEELFRDDVEPHLAEIAHHLALAAPLGEAERAVEFSIRAADRSREVFAYEDAAELYERALRLLHLAPASPPRTAEIHLKLGDALARAGSVEGARSSFEQAAAIARRAHATEIFAAAALGYGAAEKVFGTFGGLALTDVQTTASGVALLEEALASLPAEDGPLRARVLAMLATEVYWQAAAPALSDSTERRDRHRALSREALDTARRLADPDVLVEALYGRYWSTLAPETLHERLDLTEQMLVAARAARRDDFTFLARQARVHCFLELCDVASVDGEIEAMDQLARVVRQPLHGWYVATLRAMRTFLDGRLAGAERAMRDALEESRLGDPLYVRYMFEHAQLLAVRWAQGRLAEMADAIRAHGVRFQGFAPWREALAAAELGDERAARSELERFAPDDFAAVPWAGLWILHTSALAEACVLVGDRARAATLYELLLPYADRNAISQTTLPFGPVATRLAMLATMLERWRDADAHFGRALALCDAMGARAIRARVLLEQARMLRARGRSGDDDRADCVLAEAGALCEELELAGIAQRVAALSGGACD
jgi:class 3 adenylate cyclase/tetratricopeptide (TPR) repeat protein